MTKQGADAAVLGMFIPSKAPISVLVKENFGMLTRVTDGAVLGMFSMMLDIAVFFLRQRRHA